jgi:hypothetical protein
LGYPSSAKATAGRRQIVLKNFKTSSSLIKEGDKVFPLLHHENEKLIFMVDLFS